MAVGSPKSHPERRIRRAPSQRDSFSPQPLTREEGAPKADRVSSEPAGAYVPPSRRVSEPRDEKEKNKKEKKQKEKSSSAGGEANGEDSQKPAGDRGGGEGAAGKEIRRFIESGNVDAAMQAFDARAAGGNVDVDTARALLMGLVRACHLHEAFQVADYLKAKSLKLPLKHFTAIILAMSQRANPMDALDLLNALEGSVAYQTKAIHNYHFHFAKLIVQEFLEEALQTLDRIANAPAFGLQENGLAAMDVVIHGGGKGGSFSLGVPALGEELKRLDEGRHGDVVAHRRGGADDAESAAAATAGSPGDAHRSARAAKRGDGRHAHRPARTPPPRRWVAAAGARAGLAAPELKRRFPRCTPTCR